MIEATALKAGTVIRVENELYSVLTAEHHAGRGQLGGVVHATAKNLRTRNVRDIRFHPGDKIEEVVLERKEVEFLYSDGAAFYFMDPESFDQFTLPKETVGLYEKYLQPAMRIPVQLYEGEPINIAFPPTVELRVTTSPPGLREHESGTYKTVMLENGLEVLAPQFIKEGDIVKIEVETGKYLERIRHEAKKV